MLFSSKRHLYKLAIATAKFGLTPAKKISKLPGGAFFLSSKISLSDCQSKNLD